MPLELEAKAAVEFSIQASPDSSNPLAVPARHFEVSQNFWRISKRADCRPSASYIPKCPSTEWRPDLRLETHHRQPRCQDKDERPFSRIFRTINFSLGQFPYFPAVPFRPFPGSTSEENEDVRRGWGFVSGRATRGLSSMLDLRGTKRGERRPDQDENEHVLGR
jgi:hypothetical protein